MHFQPRPPKQEGGTDDPNPRDHRIHIAFVCKHFEPDSVSTSQLFSPFMRGLAREFDITVLTGFPWDQRDLPRHEFKDGLSIHRLGFRKPSRYRKLSRLLGDAAYLTHCAWRLLWLRPPQLLFGTTNPPFAVWLLGLFQGLKRIPAAAAILDIYPDGLIRTGVMRSGSIIARLWRKMNGFCFSRLPAVITLGEDMAQLLSRDYGVNRDRIRVIPHWSPQEPAQPMAFDASPLTHALGLHDKFVLQYAGNMGLWHDMETIIDTAGRLVEHDSIHFLIAGDGLQRSQMQAASTDLPNVTWLDPVPLTQWQQLLACSHLCLVSLRADLQGIAVPCKLYGIMAAARPVLAAVPATSQIALTLREHDCGVVIAPGHASAMTDAILHCAQHRDLTQAMADRSYRAYCQRYTMQQASQSYARCFRAVSNPSRRQ